MHIKSLPQTYQWTLITIVLLCVLAAYAQFRLVPFYQEVATLNNQLEVDEQLLKSPNIPEEPSQDSEELTEKLRRLKRELAGVAGQASNLEQRLAPIDSQDVLLKISAVARTARVKVVQNLPYLVQRRVKVDEITGKKSKKKLKAAAKRKQQRKLRKKAKKNNQQYGGVVGVLTREGELMDQLVNDFEEARPLQEVTIEGTFDSLKTFIEAVRAFSWQVTIVKMDFEVKGSQKSPQGLPQILTAKMIIGM